MIEVERVTAGRDCEHCNRTYGTLGCCSTVSNKWVYSCEEGHKEYAETHKQEHTHMTIPETKQNLIALGCMCNSKGIYDDESAETVKVAIKSLEAWEKIRNEITMLPFFNREEVVNVIDKHLAELRGDTDGK